MSISIYDESMDITKFVERKDYNRDISIKLVMPVGCNAKCAFCYNKENSMAADEEVFLSRFTNSLDDLLSKFSRDSVVSLDITGGEPTMNVDLFEEVLSRLPFVANINKVSRVVLTTNGLNLGRILTRKNYFEGLINYVNLSTHDYSFDHRRFAFKTSLSTTSLFPLTGREIQIIAESLACMGIPLSMCAVMSSHNHMNTPFFKNWIVSFIDWAKLAGAISLRVRQDVYDDVGINEYFPSYMDAVRDMSEFRLLVEENTPDSHWMRLRRDDGFRLFMLRPVVDTSVCTKGIEYVIHNDGKAYCDFYKRTTIEEYEKAGFEVGKIYDKKELCK